MLAGALTHWHWASMLAVLVTGPTVSLSCTTHCLYRDKFLLLGFELQIVLTGPTVEQRLDVNNTATTMPNCHHFC